MEGINSVAILGLGSVGAVYTQLIVKNCPETKVFAIVADDEKYRTNSMTINNEILPIELKTPDKSDGPVDLMIIAVLIGADGILAPMTETVEAAQKLIELGKYAPLGSRGISLMRPHSEYNPGEINSYMDKANRRTLFFDQIETDIGVQNAEKIAAVEGIDGLLMGPNDLAADYGLPGVFDNPKMESAIQKVIKAAEKSNKPSGIISSKIDFLRKCKAMGMTIFSCNSEVGLLYQGAKRAKYEFFAD